MSNPPRHTSLSPFVARLRDARPAGPAVGAVELCRFEDLRTALGYRAADAVIAALGDALRRLVGVPADVVRFGDASFLVRLPDDRPAVAFAAKTLAHFEAPLRVGPRDVPVDVAIGLAAAPRDPTDPHRAIDDALAGLATAKQHGSGYAFGDRGESPAPGALETEMRLREAIATGGLDVHFQPQLSAPDGRLQGAEALVRWSDPDGNPVLPNRFLPLAETSGLIGPLGEAVLARATSAWARRFGPDGGGLRVAVNVAPRQLADPWFADEVLAILELSGLQPGALELELTERGVLDDIDRSGATMARLGRAGVRFALDDFGTGYSSLRVLADLPFDVVKLDRSLLADLPDCRRKQAIVRSVVAVSADLGLAVLAEGVESARQLACVRRLGCSLVQGFYLGRPGPLDALAAEPVAAAGSVAAA